MNNLSMVMQVLRSGGNPQQMVMNMLKQGATSSPMNAQILDLASRGDTAGLEKLARNMCQSAGKDYDTEMAQFKKSIGI